MTLQEYAKTRNITYEAVRQAVKKASPDIDSHITKNGRTRILDNEAVKILDTRRKGSSVTVIKAKATETEQTVDQLKNEIILLQRQLIACKDELKTASESVARLEAVTENNKRLQDDNDKKQAEIERLQTDLGAFHRTFFGFYRKDKKGGN